MKAPAPLAHNQDPTMFNEFETPLLVPYKLIAIVAIVGAAALTAVHYFI